jgi:hypothetical protein
MISRFLYNKSKKETIILIHGLFANSGFWLNYLIFFKNYRLVIYNVNYTELLNNNFEISDLQLDIYKRDCDDKVVAVIAHSLGTVLADLLSVNSRIPIFNICPIAFSSRVNSLKFVDYISGKVKMNLEEIESSLLKVDKIINLIKIELVLNRIYLIPNQDSYFIYNPSISAKLMFNGGHFDIHDAIRIILKKL